ncbi:MAG: VanZ family protein [Eubacterium sp.]|nr:VanZ family protein [Eubacterium sp.]
MKAKKRRQLISFLSFIGIVLYGVIIIYFTLFSDRMGRVDNGSYQYNLIPFNEILRFMKYREYVSTRSFIINICGNFLVFAPLGFLLPIWYPRAISWYKIILYSFSFSLCIELMQLYTRVGVFDVDDLIMNTTGGFLGWILYQVLHLIFRKRRRKKRS